MHDVYGHGGTGMVTQARALLQRMPLDENNDLLGLRDNHLHRLYMQAKEGGGIRTRVLAELGACAMNIKNNVRIQDTSRLRVYTCG